MEELLCSSPTELWYPYSRPEGTNGGQGAADREDYPTDSPNYPRLDRVTAGL